MFSKLGVLHVSAVNLWVIFGSAADTVRLPVEAATPTPISFLELSVNMGFHLLYLFSTTFLNLFW